jgi:hypothetical protein
MSKPNTNATQMEHTIEKTRAPSNGRIQPQHSSKNVPRKVKKKSDGPLQMLAGWLLDNQTGMSRNPIDTDSVLTLLLSVSPMPTALEH